MLCTGIITVIIFCDPSISSISHCPVTYVLAFVVIMPDGHAQHTFFHQNVPFERRRSFVQAAAHACGVLLSLRE
jgi:hypothetical protein